MQAELKKRKKPTPKKRKHSRPKRRFVECEHCKTLFEEQSFADNINLIICPVCHEYLNRFKMLKEYNKRQRNTAGGLPCPICKKRHSRKDINAEGKLICKNCGHCFIEIYKEKENVFSNN